MRRIYGHVLHYSPLSLWAKCSTCQRAVSLKMMAAGPLRVCPRWQGKSWGKS